MYMSTDAHFKRAARTVRTALQHALPDLNHTHALEVTARLAGYHDWNTAHGLINQGRALPMRAEYALAHARHAAAFLRARHPDATPTAEHLARLALSAFDDATLRGTPLDPARLGDRLPAIVLVCSDDPVIRAAALRTLARAEAQQHSRQSLPATDSVALLGTAPHLLGDLRGPHALGGGVLTPAFTQQAVTAYLSSPELDHCRRVVLTAESGTDLALLTREYRRRLQELTFTAGLPFMTSADAHAWLSAQDLPAAHAALLTLTPSGVSALTPLRTAQTPDPLADPRERRRQNRLWNHRREQRYAAFAAQTGWTVKRAPTFQLTAGRYLHAVAPDLRVDHANLWFTPDGDVVITNDPYASPQMISGDPAYAALRAAGWTVELARSLHNPHGCTLAILRAGRPLAALREDVNRLARQQLRPVHTLSAHQLGNPF